ncbi:MAG: hypothetical protein FWE06_06700 [Oscillospiraceae bacterium]|nr:hypothetical protein [Oscillospiraceae bacterium]
MKKIISILIVALLFTGTVGVSALQPPTWFTLRVRVVNEFGEPMEGVQFHAYGFDQLESFFNFEQGEDRLIVGATPMADREGNAVILSSDNGGYVYHRFMMPFGGNNAYFVLRMVSAADGHRRNELHTMYISRREDFVGSMPWTVERQIVLIGTNPHTSDAGVAMIVAVGLSGLAGIGVLLMKRGCRL